MIGAKSFEIATRQKLSQFDIIQPACFGPGCYIEMTHSCHQPTEYVLVGEWKQIFGEKQAVTVAGSIMNQSEKVQQLKQLEFRGRRSR